MFLFQLKREAGTDKLSVSTAPVTAGQKVKLFYYLFSGLGKYLIFDFLKVYNDNSRDEYNNDDVNYGWNVQKSKYAFVWLTTIFAYNRVLNFFLYKHIFLAFSLS